MLKEYDFILDFHARMAASLSQSQISSLEFQPTLLKIFTQLVK